MTFRRIIGSTGALLVLAAAPLAAQNAAPEFPIVSDQPAAVTPPVTPDSTRGRLATVVVTAEKTRRPRTNSALERENRKLRRVIAMQDARIAELRTRISAAKARNEAKEREIASLDSATADTRAQRMALEAKLAQMETTIARGPDR